MIRKLKVLKEPLKSVGLPSKTVISNFNGFEDGNTLIHDAQSISKIFKNLFSN